MIHAFPKIFAVGSDYILDLFKGEVEVTEKIDGSQFVFGKIDGQLYMRSKGKQIFPEAPEKLFKDACEYVLSIQNEIPDNTIFFCEYLRVPKHNVLNYNRIPQNHLILFGAYYDHRYVSDYYNLVLLGKTLNIETVPLLYRGKIDDAIQLLNLLETDSILGNVQIEGVVVKNYNQPFLLGGQPIPIMMGKYVSEKFKEKHKSNWKGDHTDKGKWELFKESYRTEARWLKSVQHLKDNGELENTPRDIGKLLGAIKEDIREEEKETIKKFLWEHFGEELLRRSVVGFPEWYKKYLLERGVDGERDRE